MKVIKHTKRILYLSGISIFISIVLLLVFGLNLSIEFTGGSNISYKVIDKEKDIENVVDILVSEYENKGVKVRDIKIENEEIRVSSEFLEADTYNSILESINSDSKVLEMVDVESVGTSIGQETIRSSIKAVIFSFVVMVLFIAYAFRNIPKPYSSYIFGYSAIIAMFHDVILTLGVFSLLGKYYGVQIDTLFITAVLTVIGFSVNDTIVVFDRIRENLMSKAKHHTFEHVIDRSINETLRRSIGTSSTLLIVLLCLFIYGGESIKYFVLTMILGTVFGTYSSIFIASPLLILLHEKRKRK